LHVIDFPIQDFRILPQKGKLATEPGIALWHQGNTGAQLEPCVHGRGPRPRHKRIDEPAIGRGDDTVGGTRKVCRALYRHDRVFPEPERIASYHLGFARHKRNINGVWGWESHHSYWYHGLHAWSGVLMVG